MDSKTAGLPPFTDFVWSRAAFEELVARGIFGPEDRVELLDGHLITMSPQNTPHATAVSLVQQYLQSAYPAGHVVRPQLPLALDEHSEPEPDLAVVRGAIRDFADHHPTSEDVVLLVEIADASLEYDRTRKLPAYARAGIREYWIFDLAGRRVEVHRNPSGRGFAETTVCGEGDEIAPAGVAVRTVVAELLP